MILGFWYIKLQDNFKFLKKVDHYFLLFWFCEQICPYVCHLKITQQKSIIDTLFSSSSTHTEKFTIFVYSISFFGFLFSAIWISCFFY